MSNKHGQAVASAFAGMTLDEFTGYVINYRNTPANGYDGMNKVSAIVQEIGQQPVISFGNSSCDFSMAGYQFQ